MVTELSSQHGQADLGLLNVSTSDLDEDVASVETNFGRFRINDRRKRENFPVLVIEDRILVKRFEDG